MNIQSTTAIALLAALVGVVAAKHLPDGLLRSLSASAPYEQYRSIVISGFADPNSAQFRNEALSKEGFYCGEVNAKNKMGGYVGFKRVLVRVAGGGGLMEGYGPIGVKDLDLRVEFYMAKANMAKKEGTLVAPDKDELLEGLAFDELWQKSCGA